MEFNTIFLDSTTHIAKPLAGDVQSKHVTIDAFAVHCIFVHDGMLATRLPQKRDSFLVCAVLILHSPDEAFQKSKLLVTANFCWRLALHPDLFWDTVLFGNVSCRILGRHPMRSEGTNWRHRKNPPLAWQKQQCCWSVSAQFRFCRSDTVASLTPRTLERVFPRLWNTRGVSLAGRTRLGSPAQEKTEWRHKQDKRNKTNLSSENLAIDLHWCERSLLLLPCTFW